MSRFPSRIATSAYDSDRRRNGVAVGLLQGGEEGVDNDDVLLKESNDLERSLPFDCLWILL